MTRSLLARIQRDSFLLSRAAGDARAAQRGAGVLAQRLARRTLTRRLYAALNSNRTSR